MIESILPALSGGLLRGPSSPTTTPPKTVDDDIPKTVTVKEPVPDPAEPVSPPSAKMLECDYDLNPSDLYQAIEAKQWDYAISLYTDKDEKKEDEKTTEENGSEPASGSVEEQSCTWVVRKESNGKLRWRLLPLHAGIIFGAPVKLIELMLQAYPEGAHHKDDQGMLPLHLAFRNEASWELMEELLTAHPQAIFVKDRKGRTPLQCGARSVSSAVSIANANNSLSKQKPLTVEQHKAMREHLSFRNVVNVIELWAQIAVSGERQRGIQESRSVLESRISQIQESHLSTLTTLKREWQAQQDAAAEQVQELHEANMTLQGQLHEAGHALQVAKAHYQELQEELSFAKIELIRREEMVNSAEAEKNAAIDGYNQTVDVYHRTVDEYQKKEAEQYATAVPDTYVVADELHASESMRHQQQLEFEQHKHQLSLKQLHITSVANKQINAYQSSNRVLRRYIDDLIDQLQSAQSRFSDLLGKYQSIRDDRSQLVRNFQRQCLSHTEQELATYENARSWLAESKRRLQDQRLSLTEDKKVEETLEFVDRATFDLSRELERIHSPSNEYIDATRLTDASPASPRAVSFPNAVASEVPPLETVDDHPPILVESTEEDVVEDHVMRERAMDEQPMLTVLDQKETEDEDAMFTAVMGSTPTAGESGAAGGMIGFTESADSGFDPAAPASSPIYESYTRKYGRSAASPPVAGATPPKLEKVGSNEEVTAAAPMTLPIIPASRVIDLSNVPSPKNKMG